MKTRFTIFILCTFILCASKLLGQEGPSKNTAKALNLFAGYGSHGFVCGGNIRVKTANSDKAGTRLYLDIGYQDYTFDAPFIFNSLPYNSDTWIMSWGAGISEEFYLSPAFHIAPFAGVRFDNAHFKDNYINTTIGNGELIRYWDGVEVGSRLKQNYGDSKLAFDIGVCLNLRLLKNLWLIGKAGVAPVKYDSNESIYGKYWADTPHLNDWAIKRSMFRAEAMLSLGF
jgi:hypothetical protein